jgi:hypothetical protein
MRLALLGLGVQPLVVTEHAAHTSGSWNSLPSNADFNFEATRLASQLIRAALNGFETCVHGDHAGTKAC